jgi:hypothetical protein
MVKEVKDKMEKKRLGTEHGRNPFVTKSLGKSKYLAE